MPLPKPDPDENLPDNLQELAVQMRKDYNENAGAWWSSTNSATTATALATLNGLPSIESHSEFHALSRDGTDFESTDEHYDDDTDPVDMDDGDF